MDQIVGVDVGSVKTNSFAWTALDPHTSTVLRSGSEPKGSAESLLAALAGHRSAALILEAPGAVPVPANSAPQDLGRERHGERGRPWSAGAGCAVLATGLAQTAWILQHVAELLPLVPTTTQLDRCAPHGTARLLLAEAFVSADCKPPPGTGGSHAADAEAAARALAQHLNEPATRCSTVICAPHGALNLLAAAALWAGLDIDPRELRRDVLAVRAPAARTIPSR